MPTGQTGLQFNSDAYGGRIQATNGVDQIFALGSGNNIWTSFQTTGNSSTWAAWAPLQSGFTFQGITAVCYTSDNRMQIYALGSDNRIWTTYETSLNGAWSGWSVL